jgi:hypothetical protein
MSHTHSPAEWSAALAIGTGVWAAYALVHLLLVPAGRTDIRQALARAIETAREEAVALAYWAAVAWLSRIRSLSRQIPSQASPLTVTEPEEVTSR